MSDNYRQTATVEQMTGRVGQEIGVSRWFPMSQSRIDTFADCTEDWYFIHTDPAESGGRDTLGRHDCARVSHTLAPVRDGL